MENKAEYAALGIIEDATDEDNVTKIPLFYDNSGIGAATECKRVHQQNIGIDIKRTTTRWSCCFAPKQIGQPEFSNQSSAICFFVTIWGAKILDRSSAIICCSDTDAL